MSFNKLLIHNKSHTFLLIRPPTPYPPTPVGHVFLFSHCWTANADRKRENVTWSVKLKSFVSNYVIEEWEKFGTFVSYILKNLFLILHTNQIL